MKTLIIIAVSKIGLVIAKQVVKFTPNKKDDALLGIVDQVYTVITKVKTGDFEVTKEIEEIGRLAESFKKSNQ